VKQPLVSGFFSWAPGIGVPGAPVLGFGTMTGLTATVRQALVILATADAEQMRARVVIGGRIAGIAGRVAVLSARGDPHGIDLSPFPGTTGHRAPMGFATLSAWLTAFEDVGPEVVGDQSDVGLAGQAGKQRRRRTRDAGEAFAKPVRGSRTCMAQYRGMERARAGLAVAIDFVPCRIIAAQLPLAASDRWPPAVHRSRRTAVAAPPRGSRGRPSRPLPLWLRHARQEVLPGLSLIAPNAGRRCIGLRNGPGDWPRAW